MSFVLPPLSLYIHLPWCVRKCPYCDFNSHAADAIPEVAYVDALLADLDGEAHVSDGRLVETIFIGGGTPSLFSPDAIARLLDGVAERVVLADDAEITLEANPGTAEAGKFRGFRDAGVNRLSIGVQSFNDGHLQRLGRIHGGSEARRAAQWARQAGFDNFNLDLMFGLPGQTQAEACADVEQAIEQQPTHISYYQLTIEPNTAFYKQPPPMPDDEHAWGIQRAGLDLLAAAGYQRYEVSAYAQAGRRCRHNLNYWQFGDYLGIGAGAHGKLTDGQSGAVARTWKIRHPGHYLDFSGQPEKQGGRTRVEVTDVPFEFLMNHLRLREGFPAAAFPARTGLSASVLEPQLAGCFADRLLEQVNGWIRCTERGYALLDEVLQRFLPESSAP